MTTTALKARKEFGKTLAADIAHRLRNEIVTCQLKPDESLKFDALRLSFGASFTTLREALTLLAAEGLVVAEEQRGYKVAPVTLDDLSDLTHARILIEVDLIRRSIENGDDDWEIRVISSLHRLAKIEERAPENYPVNVEWKSAHRQFHEALVSACGLADIACRAKFPVRSRRALSQSVGVVPAASARQDRRTPGLDAGRHQPQCRARLQSDTQRTSRPPPTTWRNTPPA